jgi:hypothetical protein
MPRAGWVKPVDDQRLSDHVALGVLTRTFPPAIVDAAIAATGKAERRSRLLPARLVVYYVLGLALFSRSGYEEVMRSLVEGLSWESGWKTRWTVPSQPAITQARTRLGPKPLAELFASACVPLATEETPGAFLAGRRLVSMDGTTLDVPDSTENADAFGRPGSARGEGAAFPKLRLVALAECATHAMFAAAMAPYGTGENTLARELAGSATTGMLVLADRGFGGSYELFSAFAKGGADLCWRAKKNATLPVLERFADGSFRSELVEATDRRARAHVTPVRVIEYRIADPGRPSATETSYRLVTTILDPAEAPAGQLAARYAERWEIESVFDELKSHQRGPAVVLRSKTPDGVRQEAWGYLCTHYAVRALMANAATDAGVDPDRISFTRTLHAARRSARAGLGTASGALSTALPMTFAEICRELVPDRRLRAAARVVKKKMSNYGLKRVEHHTWPQPTLRTRDAVRVLGMPS